MPTRTPALAALLLSLLSGARAAASDGVTFGGHVKGFLFQQVADPFHLDRAGSRLQLAAWGGLGEPAEYYAAVDFELDSRLLQGGESVLRGEGFDIYPVEVYLNLSKGPFELRLGQQFIFWGRVDWVTITDVITAWDFANMASEIEDYRLAPLAARLNWYILDELMLDLVWLPIFGPNRIPSTTPGNLGGVPVSEMPPDLPEHHPRNGEFGIRLSHSVSSWALDWAICAYKGFEKSPAFVAEPVLAEPPAPPVPTGFSWTRRYDPLWMVGVDFSKAIGSFVIKGEAALKLTDDSSGADPMVRNSRADYALGLTYTWSEDLSIGAQYVSHYLIDYGRKKERLALNSLYGAPPDFVAKAWTHQTFLMVTAGFLDDFGTQVLGLYDASYRDFFVLGFVWWDIADGLKLFVGGVGFGGENDTTPFGRQTDSSRAFVELKYSF
ncbi:DUF1302 family protein [Myxococcota bacterium]